MPATFGFGSDKAKDPMQGRGWEIAHPNHRAAGIGHVLYDVLTIGMSVGFFHFGRMTIAPNANCELSSGRCSSLLLPENDVKISRMSLPQLCGNNNDHFLANNGVIIILCSLQIVCGAACALFPTTGWDM